MKIEVKDNKLIVDGLDVFEHIKKLENEVNLLSTKIKKLQSKLIYYKSTEWGAKSLGILNLFEDIIEGEDKDENIWNI